MKSRDNRFLSHRKGMVLYRGRAYKVRMEKQLMSFPLDYLIELYR